MYSLFDIKLICNQYYNQISKSFQPEQDHFENLSVTDMYFRLDNSQVLHSKYQVHLGQISEEDIIKLKIILTTYSFDSTINLILCEVSSHPYAQVLDNLFLTAGYEIEEPLIVFRGISSISKYKKRYNGTDNIHTFISTTTSLCRAMDFSSYNNLNKDSDNAYEETAILMISLPKKTRVLFIPRENEILLERNKYIMRNIKFIGKVSEERENNLYTADITNTES
jgi:hypothetical protein